MNINIKLNKNFTTAFNKMQDEYEIGRAHV